MGLFREILYTLLGLVMNLCLQSPILYEVWHSFLPARSPGTPQARAIARADLIFTKRIAWGLTPWRREWGMLDRCSVTLSFRETCESLGCSPVGVLSTCSVLHLPSQTKWGL